MSGGLISKLETVFVPWFVSEGNTIQCLCPVGQVKGYEMWDTWKIVKIVPQFKTCLVESNNGHRAIRAWAYMRAVEQPKTYWE